MSRLLRSDPKLSTKRRRLQIRPAVNLTQKRKMKRVPPPPLPIQEPVEELNINGITLEMLAKRKRVDKEVVDGLLSFVPNDGQDTADSLYQALSQMLFGNVDSATTLRKEVCDFVQTLRPTSKSRDYKRPFYRVEAKEVCDIDDTVAYLRAAAVLYHFNYILFARMGANDASYQLTQKHTETNKPDLYLRFQDDRYMMGDRKFDPRLSDTLDEEFVVERILKHRPVKFTDVDDAEFLVKWEGHPQDANSWEPWSNLLPTKVMHAYIQSLSIKKVVIPGLDKAMKDIKEYNQMPEGEDAKEVKEDKGSKESKKKNTGKKISVVGDILKFNGDGGIYAVLPYEQLDDKNKAIFKIGMTHKYSSRVEQMHTYFPEGVYWVSLYSDPELPKWSPAQLREWKANHEGKPPSVKDQKQMYYRQIEKYVFAYVENRHGKRIHATSRVRNPDELEQGETEWIYTSEDTIHAAFASAEKKFPGGRLQHYYLSGLDPDTNQLVTSINDLAKARMKEVPNYTGRVIFRM